MSPGTAYVKARAAAIGGDHGEAAELYAALVRSSGDKDLVARAVSEAISAGNMPLALQLIRSTPGGVRSIDGKLLQVADSLRRRQYAEASALLADKQTDLSFWLPLVQAWSAAETGNAGAAASVLRAVPKNSALGSFVDEQIALILLRLGRSAEAEPFAEQALLKAGPREPRVRLALAAGYDGAKDRKRALAVLAGAKGSSSILQRALEGGNLKGARIDSAAKAYSEQLVALALEMRRSNPRGAPVNVLQVARYAAPENSSATVLLGSLLASVDRTEDAVAVLRSIDPNDAFAPEALDAQVRALTKAERVPEALAIAQRSVARKNASSDDFARLGDVLADMKRSGEAVDAYRRAVALTPAGQADQRWPLLLLQASALESAGRWPEAKVALVEALGLAPDEPALLNFLGYAKLEHGEDLEAAEAMIRKASELVPDDASITDSLGWALFKRGRTEEAIKLLQAAAVGDPAQAEIHEHLGDALFTAGRRFEARFAWEAALSTADDEDTARLKSKLATGLTPATAAR